MSPPSYKLSTALSLLAAVVPSVRAQQDTLDEISIVNIEDVRGNLHLPTNVDGYSVTWSSTNTDVISPGGEVSRQDSNTEVTLTASIEHEGQVYEREFSASVRQAPQLEPFEAYAFSYFTGNSLEGENIYFAASNGNNALDWQELNNGRPVLRSNQGTRGLRDPFLIRSPEGDVFYMIATDLSIGSGTSWGDAVRRGSHYLEVWESHDLVNWSEQRHVRVAPANAGNTWAPEAFWDPESGSYAVFWASSLYGEDDPNHQGASYHRMMYSLTRDFVTFSEPEVWQDAGDSRIDTTVLAVSDGPQKFLRFTKDEGSVSGCTDIIQEASDSLLAPVEQWTTQATCIAAKAGLAAVEGPTVFKANPGDVHGEKFYLFVDEYVNRGYIPLATEDPNNPNWRVPASYNLPSSPRHGTVIPVTAAEHEALVAALTPRRKQRAETMKSARKVAEGVVSDVTLSDSALLKVPPIVNSNFKTAVFPAHPGTDLTNLAPVFSLAEGVTASPESGQTVDLSGEVTYVFSKDGSVSEEWTFTAAEMRSPVLPGMYADPNIAVVGDTYYIFATTDGFPGWGGNEFYWWKSSDLVSWERGEEPFLVLDGENGNVPWAGGNAWAPGFAARNGKYYFYFSGENLAVGQGHKSIGVAVADHPEGPYTAQPKPMIVGLREVEEVVTGWGTIDIAAFEDPVSGKWYAYWGNGEPCVVAEFNEDMISLKTGTFRAIQGLNDFREAPFVSYRDGLYHMTYSIDDTGSENYRIGYATSDSPLGPWTYHGLLLQKDPVQGILGTGHNSVVNVPGTDDWFIVYHRFAMPGGGGFRRETTIDRIEIDPESGLFLPVTPTLESVGPQPISRQKK